ncbi:MAG: HAD family phosphatase [Verrucomicrobiae bacterium]|nr:HAD family phosphatase [Verrucomicrobiae bacterium]MCP5539161.1 HAD family phosphatase [Akkermansiaceae bacterium]MCP5549812.1 HAD family phosphatase [Akkermansiaceae bacterium]
MILDLPDRDFAGYIFDCDGTLVDSMPLHFRAWNASFRHHGAPFEWTEERFYAGAGVPDREIVAALNAEFDCDLDGDAVHDFKAAWFVDHLTELTAVAAVAEIVRDLHARGAAMAVATGSDLAIVDPELRHVGLRHFFEIIVTPKDVKRGKPAPDMFLLAAEKLGVAPAGCLVFEDGQAGLQAAEAAGMASVFVPSAPAPTRQG